MLVKTTRQVSGCKLGFLGLKAKETSLSVRRTVECVGIRITGLQNHWKAGVSGLENGKEQMYSQEPRGRKHKRVFLQKESSQDAALPARGLCQHYHHSCKWIPTALLGLHHSLTLYCPGWEGASDWQSLSQCSYHGWKQGRDGAFDPTSHQE